MKNERVWLYSLGNYAARLAISLLFVLFVAVLPLSLALVYSLVVGFALISLISYSIARHNGTSPVWAIAERLWRGTASDNRQQVFRKFNN